MRILCCGSAHRSGSRGWTDETMVERFLATVNAPTTVIMHGASKSDGLDEIVDRRADALGIAREPYPVDSAKDGASRGSPLRRNERMAREGRARFGAAWSIGSVGEIVGTRGCYLTNGSDHMVKTLRAREIPVVIFRENGVEPCKGGHEALTQLRRLYAVTREAALVAPGKAVAAWVDRGSMPGLLNEVRKSLACARETLPRLTPWLTPVELAFATIDQHEALSA
jgi:hypothetical protein